MRKRYGNVEKDASTLLRDVKGITLFKIRRVSQNPFIK
jgi:hypothetical protein